MRDKCNYGGGSKRECLSDAQDDHNLCEWHEKMLDKQFIDGWNKILEIQRNNLINEFGIKVKNEQKMPY